MLNQIAGYHRSRLGCTSTPTNIIPNRPGPITSSSFASSFDSRIPVVEILSSQLENEGLFRGRHAPRRTLGHDGAAEQFVSRHDGYCKLGYRHIGKTTG
jgi:hypothetical protein